MMIGNTLMIGNTFVSDDAEKMTVLIDSVDRNDWLAEHVRQSTPPRA